MATMYRTIATDRHHGGIAVQGVYPTLEEAEARREGVLALALQPLEGCDITVEAFDPLRPLRDAVASQRHALKARLDAEGVETDPILFAGLSGEPPTAIQSAMLEAYDALGIAAKHLSEAVYEQEGKY